MAPGIMVLIWIVNHPNVLTGSFTALPCRGALGRGALRSAMRDQERIRLTVCDALASELGAR